MAEQRDHDKDEFYEAMPGTMSGTQLRDERQDESDRNINRNYVLPWIVALGVILLGLFLIGAMDARNSAGTTAPQNSNPAPAGNQSVPSY